MGRAPAVALAYMWWYKGIHLDDAFALLLSKRQCSPKLYAIRQAADDTLYGGSPQKVVITKRGSSMSKTVEIAGTLYVHAICSVCFSMSSIARQVQGQ